MLGLAERTEGRTCPRMLLERAIRRCPLPSPCRSWPRPRTSTPDPGAITSDRLQASALVRWGPTAGRVILVPNQPPLRRPPMPLLLVPLLFVALIVLAPTPAPPPVAQPPTPEPEDFRVIELRAELARARDELDQRRS